MIVTAGFSWQCLIPFDIAVRNLVGGWHSPWLYLFFTAVTSLGNSVTFYILAPLAALVLLWRDKKLEALFVSACLLASWGLDNILKMAFSRPRPPGPALVLAAGYSFPSGHAMISLAFYGFIAFLIVRNWDNICGKSVALGLSLVILLIGLSRVYLNVHYASDVIAGWVFGAAVLGLFVWGLIKVENR